MFPAPQPSQGTSAGKASSSDCRQTAGWSLDAVVVDLDNQEQLQATPAVGDLGQGLAERGTGPPQQLIGGLIQAGEMRATTIPTSIDNAFAAHRGHATKLCKGYCGQIV